MISTTKAVIILFLLSWAIHAQEVTFNEDGPYRMLASVHLIDNVHYKSSDKYQAVIEIPTGSRNKWEVNHKSGHLEWEFKKDKPRKVKFLGYPGNYGFIPQTLSDDGDPIDIIVLSESAKMGAILKIKVIGMIKLIDKGEKDNKIIAVTTDGAFKKIDTLKEMLIKKPNVVPIVKQWFEGYKNFGKIVFVGYGSKKKTVKYIEKAHRRWLAKVRH